MVTQDHKGRAGPGCSKNANPGLKVNRGNNFSSIKIVSKAYILCSLRLLMVKTEGQTIQKEHLAEKFSLILV